MLTSHDTLAGDIITFHYCEGPRDFKTIKQFMMTHTCLAIDTESTGLNCYVPSWELRTIQVGDASTSYVIPAKFRDLIEWIIRWKGHWIGHNLLHDIRCIDSYLGYDSEMVASGETHIPSHHMDSRNRLEGGVGHRLKELACHYIDPKAAQWEVRLNQEFKKIRVNMDGVYKSGKNKGKPKTRVITLSEGWALIDPKNPAYIAYAALDPILTWRIYAKFQSTIKANLALYHFDKRVDEACDRLHRRGILCDVEYTRQIDTEFYSGTEHYSRVCEELGCGNIQSGAQIADAIEYLGATLTAFTKKSGTPQTTDVVLRELAERSNEDVRLLIHSLLTAKQLSKRRAAYTQNFLINLDANNRIHPSIHTRGARTGRMSVSKPALQQLPTKDRSDDLDWQ